METGPEFTSSRGVPLVLRRTPIQPTVTVEDYTKWYTLQLVYPDGTVEDLDFPGADGNDIFTSGSSFVGHVPNPEAVALLAERNGWAIDERSFEIMIGRWYREVLEKVNQHGADVI